VGQWGVEICGKTYHHNRLRRQSSVRSCCTPNRGCLSPAGYQDTATRRDDYLLIVRFGRGEFESRLGRLGTRLHGGRSSVRGRIHVIAETAREREANGRVEGSV